MKICVFCASSANIDKKYHTLAYNLGKFIAQKGHKLVYGGATGGLMDSLALGASEAEGEIIGVIPEIIINSNRKSPYPTQFIITDSMNERKNKMKSEADMFIALPGGYGTLDELFDVITSAIVGEHNKPLLCMNFNRIYDPLIMLVDRLKKENLIPVGKRYAPQFVNDFEECKSLINKISEIKWSN